MERAAVFASTPPVPSFQDGLGERRQLVDSSSSSAQELLCLRAELAAVPSFEFALRERVSRLATFRHAYYGRVRGVERLTDREATLAVVSDHVVGVRLSELLANAEARRLPLDINTGLCLIRQLVPAVAMLHENARDVAHGAIGPERLIVTPNARLVVVEYVMGAALEQLRFSQERYWNDLRIPMPRSAGLPRFDHRADVTQLGVVALSLILGRLLRADEYPTRVADLVASTWAVSARGGFEPLPPGLRGWLGRALQLDARNAFASAIEARVELDKVLGDSDYMASPANLEAFLARYNSSDRPVTVTTPQQEAAHSQPPYSEPAFQGIRPQQVEPVGRVPSPIPIVQPAPVASAIPVPPPTTPAPAAPPVAPMPAPAQAAQALPPPIEFTPVVDPWPAESAADTSAPKKKTSRGFSSKWTLVGAAVAALVLLVVGAIGLARWLAPASPAAVETGTLVVTTEPTGVQVAVDGTVRGVTPITMTLAPGNHMLELHGPGDPRSLPVTITAGAQVAQYVELAKAGWTAGQLQIRSEPSGAQVSVDGVVRGQAPMTVLDLTPGEHVVTVESDLGSVKQTVMIEAGATASLVVPMTGAASGPAPGWISVSSPLEVQLYENGRLLGSSQSDRIMVPAGKHQLELTNTAVGFQSTRVVQVTPNKVTALTVEAPKGTIALNAIPWAEVWIDGVKVGETPIGNLPMAIGSHDVVFRHPELGEQHHTAMVTLTAPARLSVDLRKR
jgi:hypothetical protein